MPGEKKELKKVLNVCEHFGTTCDCMYIHMVCVKKTLCTVVLRQ